MSAELSIIYQEVQGKGPSCSQTHSKVFLEFEWVSEVAK